MEELNPERGTQVFWNHGVHHCTMLPTVLGRCKLDLSSLADPGRPVDATQEDKRVEARVSFHLLPTGSISMVTRLPDSGLYSFPETKKERMTFNPSFPGSRRLSAFHVFQFLL